MTLYPPGDFTDGLYGMEAGVPTIYAADPLLYNTDSGALSIKEAGALSSGVISTLAQTLAGTKTFGSIPKSTATTIANEDLCTKAYLDARVALGNSWQQEIYGFYDFVVPLVGVPNGTRYIAITTVNGFTANYIYQYSTAQAGWIETIPLEGYALYVMNDDSPLFANLDVVYNGSEWVSMGTTINHDSLLGVHQDVKTNASPSFPNLTLTTGTITGPAGGDKKVDVSAVNGISSNDYVAMKGALAGSSLTASTSQITIGNSQSTLGLVYAPLTEEKHLVSSCATTINSAAGDDALGNVLEVKYVDNPIFTVDTTGDVTGGSFSVARSSDITDTDSVKRVNLRCGEHDAAIELVNSQTWGNQLAALTIGTAGTTLATQQVSLQLGNVSRQVTLITDQPTAAHHFVVGAAHIVNYTTADDVDAIVCTVNVDDGEIYSLDETGSSLQAGDATVTGSSIVGALQIGGGSVIDTIQTEINGDSADTMIATSLAVKSYVNGITPTLPAPGTPCIEQDITTVFEDVYPTAGTFNYIYYGTVPFTAHMPDTTSMDAGTTYTVWNKTSGTMYINDYANVNIASFAFQRVTLVWSVHGSNWLYFTN